MGLLYVVSIVGAWYLARSLVDLVDLVEKIGGGPSEKKEREHRGIF